MNPTTTAALQLLLRQMGDADALCRRLWISRDELDDYLSGTRAIPPSVTLHALDILGKSRKIPTLLV